MELVAAVTMLAVLEYMVIVALVGRARLRSGIAAPATTGDPIFERWFRVQQNSVEQLVAFLPSLWVFATYVHPIGAAALGLVFVAGRAWYARAYVADPAKRGPGFTIGGIAVLALAFGGLGGAIVALL